MVQGLFSPRGAPFPLRPATFVGPWVLRSRPYHPRLVGAPLGRARLDYPQGGPGFLRVYYPNLFEKTRRRVPSTSGPVRGLRFLGLRGSPPLSRCRRERKPWET